MSMTKPSASQINFTPSGTLSSTNVQSAITELVTDLAASSGSSMAGYLPAGTGAVSRTVQSKLRESVSVMDFGAVGDGVTDDTVAIQAAIDYGIANGIMVIIPLGQYAVDSVQIKDAVYNFTLHCENALLFAIATVPRIGLIDVVNAVDFHMTGSWHFFGADNSNYDAGLYIRAQTGTSQSTTRVNLCNPTFRNFKIGMAVGVYTIDYQCSEINVFGANFFKCPIAVYNGGSNTGAQYIGCNIVSEPNTAFPSTPERAIWQEGGFVKVVGGSIVTNPACIYAILVNPCSSALYSANLYGYLNVVGAHVEVNSGLMQISNNRSLTSPDSSSSNYSFSCCTGYSGAPAASDFVLIGDASYAGLIDIRGNNWYSSVVRTAWSISSASPYAKIQLDKTSFGKNFLVGWKGVSSGKVIHGNEPILNVFGLSQTYLAGTSNVLKFLSVNTSVELSRYSGNYDPATGFFTIPIAFSYLVIVCGIAGTTAVAGDFYLKRNGAIVAFGSFSGIGLLQFTALNLSPGENLSVTFDPRGADYATDGGAYNFLQISGAT